MNAETWEKVDEYFANALVPTDRDLEAARAANAAAGLPAIDVSPLQGRLLYLLAKLQGARRILEMGTLGGYSTLCLAQAQPADGRIVTLEAEPRHAAVARANFERAGVADRIEVIIGPALESLPRLHAAHAAPFDLVFIDADKPNTADYFTWAVKLGRPGTLIIVDNVVRRGGLADARSEDESVQGMRRFIDRLAHEPAVEATGVQTVGRKGYDGFVLARVR